MTTTLVPERTAAPAPHSGHNADAEEPARYNDLLIKVVRPETRP